MVKDRVEFRLIVERPGEGQWNMAIDEALLEAVSEGGKNPVIRLYGFDPPTLSVGRFQPTKEVVDFSRAASEGVTFVRRPSGGQSVLHTDELTYAFVIGKDHLEPFGKRWVYRFIAPLLISGLVRLGLDEARTSSAQKGDPTNPDCFGSTGQYEIDSGAGRKLIGSAQMVSRTAVLQHGSIPLSAKSRQITRYLGTSPAQEDHSSNLQDEIGRYVEFSTVEGAFAESLSERLSVRIDSLLPAERMRATELLREKYSTDEWNRKY